MALLRPLRAVRPRSDAAQRVASVPYDVVDTAEARRMAAGNPLSFLRVVRAEIDLPEEADPYGDEVYRQAVDNYHQLQREGVLLRDPEAALFLYRQTAGDHQQTAVVGLCSLEEYDRGVIKKHETTRPDKEEDRARHIVELRCQAEPVFLAYRGRPEIDRLVSAIAESAAPSDDFYADDGVRHTVWRVSEVAPLVDAFASVPAFYIADGHHRSASASRARRRLHEMSPREGEAPWDLLLAAVFPAEELRILPYNRLVHDLAGRSPESFLEELSRRLEVTPGGDRSPQERGQLAMLLEGRWYTLTVPRRSLEANDPVATLDAAILQSEVLGPLLGIEDPRTSPRIEFVGGSRGADELERRVESRPGSVAFSLHPVGIEQLLAVADVGRALPPKSTWFEPKLRSGLVLHDFAVAEQEGAGRA
jgi:uncharacterized protein (DUF1015 family)